MMKKLWLAAFAIALLPLLASAKGLEVGKAGASFKLAGPGGKTVTLSSLLSAKGTKALVVDFASVKSSFSRKADKSLEALAPSLAKKGVALVSLYPNAGESVAQIRAYAQRAGVKHLLLRDPGGAVARAFGAEVTPTFFLFDKSGVLRYRGPFDDLGTAVDSVVSGKTVAKPAPPSVGNTIRWVEQRVPPLPYAGRGHRSREHPRHAPGSLSPAAKAWLGKLVEGLGSRDELVRRSAMAGLLQLGPAAIAELRARRAKAMGPESELLDRAIRALAVLEIGPRPRETRTAEPRGRASGRRGEARRGRRGGAFLEMAKQRIEKELPDLTADQKKKLDQAFAGLAEKVNAARKAMRTGDREAARAAFRGVREAMQKALDEILTPKQRAKLKELRRERAGRRRNR